MSVIKIEDIAYVRFQAPDLARMRAFLETFGLVACDGAGEALYMRGRGEAPLLHVTEQGEPKFLALGFRAASVADLEALATHTGAPAQPFEAPGGGKIVRLKDPDGHGVEVVAGQTAATTLPIEDHLAWNNIHDRPRQRAVKRTGAGASTVMRLGHGVLNVSNFRASEAWYKALFGFITSDEIAVGPEMSLGAFLRCDRGDTPTDHHTLFLAQLPSGPGFNHAAFEVRDMDDLMRGHSHLKAAGAEAEWGVGRHFLGSQVFDYWRDPWGFTLEHWTDGDLFTADDPPRTATLQDLLGVQWGMAMPPSMTG
jgi:catechol 2,3-dioxygenase-like lactoylglutathione lyase family enzyme